METNHNVDDLKLSPDGSSELPTQQELSDPCAVQSTCPWPPSPAGLPSGSTESRHCWFPCPAVSSEQSQSHRLSLPLTLHCCLCSCR